MKNSMSIDCPQCGKKATFTETTQNIAHFGDVSITTIICKSCGYRFNDVMTVEERKKPNEFRILVKTPADLNTKIVRSSSSTVSIPELGLEATPGPQSEGYISNIEGLLERFAMAVSLMLNNPDKKKLANEIIEKINDAKKVKKPFEVILKDPYGNSALIGETVFETGD